MIYWNSIGPPVTLTKMCADLKPNNIVFAHKDREDLEVKIIDFGLAKDLAEGTDIPISTCGTPEFTSPGQISMREGRWSKWSQRRNSPQKSFPFSRGNRVWLCQPQIRYVEPWCDCLHVGQWRDLTILLQVSQFYLSLSLSIMSEINP